MGESQAVLSKGEYELRRGNKKEAYKKFIEAAEKCQENHEAHARIGEMFIEAKDYVKAHQHLETAIHYMPKRAKYYYLKGKIFYHEQQWEEALNEFKRATTENENEKEPVFFYMIAEMQFKLGDYDAAILNYRESEKMIYSYEQGKIKESEFSHESRVLANVKRCFPANRTKSTRFF